MALDLTDGGLLVGLARPGGPSLVTGTVRARAVVLATGGFGQAYATTTNPAGVTGDGLALAARAGAALRDVEFVQFHPTVLWDAEGRGQCPLITEALRGAGAVIVDDLAAWRSYSWRPATWCRRPCSSRCRRAAHRTCGWTPRRSSGWTTGSPRYPLLP